MMDILEVYILSVTGLEALINEICLDKIDQRREHHKSIRGLKKLVDDYDGHYIDLKSKFDRLPQLLWNTSFDKSGKTWCDFDALINLRNDLVHYTPHWEKPGYVPEYLRAIYQRVSPKAKRSDDGSTLLEMLVNRDASFVGRICNVGMGQWAFGAARAMIRDLFALWPRKDMMREDYMFMFERSGIRL